MRRKTTRNLQSHVTPRSNIKGSWLSVSAGNKFAPEPFGSKISSGKRHPVQNIVSIPLFTLAESHSFAFSSLNPPYQRKKSPVI